MRGGFGGAEKVMERFAKSLDTRWRIHVVTAGAQVAGVRMGGVRGPNWWRAYQYALHVNRLLENQPNNLSFSMERGPKAYVYRAGDGVHRRWIELRYGRSWRWRCNPWHWLAPRLERQTLQSVATIIANSNMVKQDIARFYPAYMDKVEVIYNGFDARVFKPATVDKAALRQSLQLPEAGRLLLFCGSGWERKGLHASLQFLAHAQRADATQPIHLVVVGKGKAHRYRHRLAELGVAPAVIFREPTREVVTYYQAADTLILPTAYDPFANACLEALACDCPVITTCWNGAAEVIQQGRTGWVLNSVAPDALRALSEQWLTFKAEAGRVAASVQTYTQENEMAQLERVLQRVERQCP